MKKITSILACFFVSLTLSSGVDAQLIIDDFDSGTTTSLVGVGMASTPTNSFDILGGQRIHSLEVPNLSGSEFFGAVGFTGGNLFVSQGSLDEVVAGLEYDLLNGIDLTNGGVFQSFQLDFTSLDSQVPLTDVLQISVTSGGTTASQNVTIPDLNSSGLVQVDLADFNGVDLTSVDSEPGSLTVLSLAASAMLLRRRRK